MQSNKNNLNETFNNFLRYQGKIIAIPERQAREIFGDNVGEDFIGIIENQKCVAIQPEAEEYTDTNDGHNKVRLGRIIMFSKQALHDKPAEKIYIYDCVNKTIAREGKVVDTTRKQKEHKDTLCIAMCGTKELASVFEKRIGNYSDGSIIINEQEDKKSFCEKCENCLSEENIKKNPIIKVVCFFDGAEMKNHGENYFMADWKKLGVFFNRMLQLASDSTKPLKGKNLIFENLACFQADKISFKNYNNSTTTKTLSKIIEAIAKKGECKVSFTKNKHKNTTHAITEMPTFNQAIYHVSNDYSVFDATQPNPEWRQVNQYEKNNFIGGSFAGYGWDGKVMHKGEAKINTESEKDKSNGKGAE